MIRCSACCARQHRNELGGGNRPVGELRLINDLKRFWGTATQGTRVAKTGLFRVILRRRSWQKLAGTRAEDQIAKLLIPKEIDWRRGWDSNSSRPFRIRKLQKLRCRDCHECRRCRRALPAIARRHAPLSSPQHLRDLERWKRPIPYEVRRHGATPRREIASHPNPQDSYHRLSGSRGAGHRAPTRRYRPASDDSICRLGW